MKKTSFICCEKQVIFALEHDAILTFTLESEGYK